MKRSKKARARKAQKKQRQLASAKLQIGTNHELRTLKRSARKQLEQERTPQLWILPCADLSYSAPSAPAAAKKASVEDIKEGNGQDNQNIPGIYPRASFLGLPTELRQQILYNSYTMEDMEHDANAARLSAEKKSKLKWTSANEPIPTRKMDRAMQVKFGLSSREAGFVSILSRRIGCLSRISSTTHPEVKYICAQWKRDLDKHLNHELQVRLDAPKIPIVAAGYEWLSTSQVASRQANRNKGEEIKIKSRQARRRARPGKCWYCTERHFGNDPVCPMARSDPKKWEQLTKKVGGRRAKMQMQPTFKTKHVLFYD